MTAKEYLMQYRRLTIKLKRLEKDIEDVRAERSSISINLDGMPHGSGLGDKVATLAAKLIDMERELIWMRSDAWEKRMEIIRAVGMLENADQSLLLQLRYIDGKTWEEIAVEMHYSFRHVLRLHGYALREFAKITDLHYMS